MLPEMREPMLFKRAYSGFAAGLVDSLHRDFRYPIGAHATEGEVVVILRDVAERSDRQSDGQP